MLPVVAANLPAEHDLHADAPDDEEKWPCSHPAHSVLPASEYVPGTHVSHTPSCTAVPGTANRPASHVKHVDAYALALTSPSPHASHAVPLIENDPAGHGPQYSTSGDSGYDPGSHLRHDVWPVSGCASPTGHTMHSLGSVKSSGPALYRPDGHALHSSVVAKNVAMGHALVEETAEVQALMAVEQTTSEQGNE